ncbi:hypothetical protein [Chryseobacterium oryctis]|uniref:Lipoprotein n=1 Tax=Chryseobacterium oryctis TaxID=2952618 RepID=A0ABT3HMG7_9FLAO|nr:hypothetical protein [Chryseobacterium oryctis]MCW3160913.1 hypothetical protein [Chryseobacterium oryctis]
MNIKVLYLLILLFISCCTSQKNEFEYVEFKHECPTLKISDKILIRILSSQKKHNNERIVELTYHGKTHIRKPINEKEYQNIIDSILKINENSQDSTIVFADGGSNIIEYRKGNVIKKYHSQVLNKEYNNGFYNAFYNACELITKSAMFDITTTK